MDNKKVDATGAKKFAANHKGTKIKFNSDSENLQLVKELHKPFIRTF